MSMPVPPTLTSYLPMLLISVTNSAAPDDASFSTLPEGQVDYLSHEWKEEDVWQSWRNMTRQKNAIANGMRLENASWRTWWKQRNKLKTISPETLNWLKDSDVTWLYGPLHVGSGWTPNSGHDTKPLNQSHRKTSLDIVTGPTISGSAPKKPILKHRSISQLLSLPASPFFTHDDESGHWGVVHGDHDSPDMESGSPSRPPLLHTKSDTNIGFRTRSCRKDSPPRMVVPHVPTDEEDGMLSTPGSGSASDQDLSAPSSHGIEKKKHISFNTFVEQCIAIEKPKRNSSRVFHPSFEDGYDDEAEMAYGDEDDQPSSFYLAHRSGVTSDSDDDDDDVIEMRTSSSRSRSSSSSRSRRSPMRTTPMGPQSHSTGSRLASPPMRQGSLDRDRVSIALIAPTMLKSTGVGNNLNSIPEGNNSQEPDLVYAPPLNSLYSLSGNRGDEDIYHHHQSYFSLGDNDRRYRSPSPSSSSRIPSVGIPIPPSSFVPHAIATPTLGAYLSRPITGSPTHDGTADSAEEHAFDYFDSEDFGRGGHSSYSKRTPQIADRREDSEDGQGTGTVRYTGGASISVSRNRGNTPWSSPLRDSADMPVVVVNDANGAVEERTERSREGSPSAERAPPPVEYDRTYGVSPYALPLSSAVPIPRVSSSQHLSCNDHGLLSPTDTGRGRLLPSVSSVSGSTTTGPSSHSSDSRSESRGRSSTRNSSYSDRERSGSRSSRGTNSPLGSISPTGSTLGIVGGQPKGRDREGRSSARSLLDTNAEVERRGRERTGRRLGESMSPPSVVGSPSRTVGEGSEYPPYSPVIDGGTVARVSSSPPSSVSGSSTTSSSTVGPASSHDTEVAHPRSHGSSTHRVHSAPIHIPPPISEEEEQRSRHPTPANSPVTSHLTPAAVVPAAPSPQSPSTPIPAAPLESKVDASPVSPTRSHRARSPGGSPDSHGTLVGRAAEIVSSARGFLGAMWNSVA